MWGGLCKKNYVCVGGVCGVSLWVCVWGVCECGCICFVGQYVCGGMCVGYVCGGMCVGVCVCACVEGYVCVHNGRLCYSLYERRNVAERSSE